ncbi:MAG: winged helix-turn-helix domain-containing protein [Candidatus Binatia bacterium]|nr:winged helix-turn-helix domain-containing protein [Candidatus Binatia bacterium]
MASTLNDIGSAAGEVWRYLDANGPTAADTLKRKLKMGSDVFYAAVGWLAREDKLQIRSEGQKTILALR